MAAMAYGIKKVTRSCVRKNSVALLVRFLYDFSAQYIQ